MSLGQRHLGLALLLGLALTVSGCVNQTVKSTSVPDVNTSSRDVPEALLLDVGITLFDPGLDDVDEDAMVYPEVRRAEARYMPYLLLESIQSSAAWGAVRVIPSAQQPMDVIVAGTIVKSNGEQLELKIVARDSRGKVWLDKGYRSRASKYSYSSTTRARIDPFQAVYNRIANDLLEQLLKRNTEDLAAIRTVNELRFARSMSPDAFAGHLSEKDDGTYSILRLPAEDDPMLVRVRNIRERDYLFIDTMQEYYETFNGQMSAPYQEWRKLSYTEAIALQELKAESTRQLIAGAAMIIAGIAAGGSNDRMLNSASTVAILGGGSIFKSGMDARTESEIHVQALEELSLSLEAEIAPQIIELDDRTITLTGNAQDQYDQWRELLQQIYQAEVGALESLPAAAGS